MQSSLTELQEKHALQAQHHHTVVESLNEEIKRSALLREDEIASFHAKSNALQSQIMELQHRISYLDETRASQAVEVEAMSKKLAISEQRLTTERFQSQELTDQLANSKKRLFETESRLHHTSEMLRTRDVELQEAKDNLADVKAQEVSVEAASHATQVLLKLAEEKILSLEEEIQALTGKLTSAQGEIDLLHHSQETLQRSHAQQKLAMVEDNATIEGLRYQLAAALSATAELERKESSCLNEIKELQSKNVSLTDELSAMVEQERSLASKLAESSAIAEDSTIALSKSKQLIADLEVDRACL